MFKVLKAGRTNKSGINVLGRLRANEDANYEVLARPWFDSV